MPTARVIGMPKDSGRTPQHPGLPQSWPSAWPSLAKQAFMGAILPIVAAVVVLVVLLLTKTLEQAWWVALIPLLLLIWPLSLPGRVQRVMQEASDDGRLEVVQGMLGTIAAAPRRRLGVRPNAEVVPGKPVRYYLNPKRQAGRAASRG